MADVKISALPASTTPLAGTEVLPIVQSSTTRQVSVANLTAGRAVSALSITASSLTSGRVTYAGTAGLLQDSANLTFNGTTLTANTIGAYTLSGTIAGGGNQINNVIIGTSTPLAGSFTTINASTSITNAGLTSGRVTYAGTAGLLQDSANLLYSGTDLTVYGLTVGRGGGAVASNTAIGSGALATNSTGATNVALGYYALNANSVGGNNVAVGRNALQNNTNDSNTAVGDLSLTTNTSGSANVGIGRQALFSNITASNNTAVGYQALYANLDTTQTAVGYQALSTLNGSSGAGGNIGIGSNCGSNKTSGYQCIYIGVSSAGSSATTFQEIVIGSQSTTGKGSSTGFINPNSGGVYQGNNSTLWSVTSDARIKKNIVDNNTGLDKITQIQVRNFEYRLPEEITEVPQDQAIKKEGVQLGVIAQELQQVLPECVKTESTGVMTVDADNLTWYMINAIKELKAEVDSLKQQLASR